MNRNEKLGNRLRQLRKEKEIADGVKCTCEQVSKALGIAPSSYSNYENALRIPKLEIIEDIAAFYNVSPSYIACFTDSKGNSNNESMLVLPSMTEYARQTSAAPLGDYGISSELLNQFNLNKDDILIEVIKDNSMADQLFKNDTVIIKKAKNHSIDNLIFGIYCLKDKNNQLWIRWVKPELDGSYQVFPSNKAHYESYAFSSEEFSQFEIVGTIFKVIRTPRFDEL